MMKQRQKLHRNASAHLAVQLEVDSVQLIQSTLTASLDPAMAIKRSKKQRH